MKQDVQEVHCDGYTRTIAMREVTFTCVICGRTVTQLRYPARVPKYCSDACITEKEARRNEERVTKQREQREKRRKEKVAGADSRTTTI